MYVPATTVSFNKIEVNNNEVRQAKIVTQHNGGGALKEIQTTIGTTYKFSFSAKLGTAVSLTAKAKAKDGTTPYNGTTLTSLSITADGNYVITFTATTNTTQLVLEKVGGHGTSQEFYLDNALVFEAPNGITAPQRFYRAEVLHATDYSPFGAPMPSRSYSYNKRDAVIVGQLAGSMSTTGWQTTYCTAPSSCTTPESSVTLSTTTEGKLRMEATKRYSQMYYTFTTVPGRVYRVKYKLSNSTMGMVNTSLFAPVALKELYTTANITTFDFEREMIFTATETTTRFYVTKGWSALATTALQQVELDYLIVVEMPSQINYISCTSINQNLTMLANAGVNINDSVQVRNHLNIYYNRNYSYAAYSQVLSGCANQTLNYVLALPGIEAEEAKEAYRFGFNGQEKDDEVAGTGNCLAFEARIFDPRLGKFYSIDPRYKEFTDLSPYQYAANSPIANIDEEGKGPGYGTLKMAAQTSNSTIAVEGGTAVEIGIIKTASMGMAVDPKGNVLLYSSVSKGPSVSMGNAGTSANVKVAGLPGVKDVRSLMGDGGSLTASCGLVGQGLASFAGVSASIEQSGGDIVGTGISLWVGPNVGAPISWSYVNTFTTATAMTGQEYNKIQNATSWNEAYKKAQEFNSKQNAGVWEVGDIKLDYMEKIVDGKTLYEAVIKTEYNFKPTKSGVNSTSTSTTTDTGVFFEKDDNGNMTSTDLKKQKQE